VAHTLPETVRTAWAGQSLGAALALRPARRSDFAWMAKILSIGEGYTLPAGSTAFDAQDMEQSLATLAADDLLLGLVADDLATRTAAGFLLGIRRNRLIDVHPPGHILSRLPASLFPANGRFLQVYDLWIDPAWRRRGLASALKLMLEAQARDLGAACILTYTEATHTTARRLNARLGYREVYEGPMWDEVDRVALIKRLA
jgi:ribosomal protein S18 acetylase RimI-like enzyme